MMIVFFYALPIAAVLGMLIGHYWPLPGRHRRAADIQAVGGEFRVALKAETDRESG